MDPDRLEKLEVLQRIAFESGRQAAVAGNAPGWAGGQHGKRDAYREALSELRVLPGNGLVLLEDIEEESAEEELLIAAYSDGIDYGTKQAEHEFAEEGEG